MNTQLKILSFLTIVVFSLTFAAGCGGNSNSDGQSAQTTESGLTEFEMENGIGPVDEKMELSSIDPSMAKKGEKLFETKCSACHKMGERYVGPAQGDLLERRTPEFIMNMILNPDEMVKKHPEAKKLLAQFMTPMPNQNLSREEARAVLEYFRYVDSTGTEQVSLPE